MEALGLILKALGLILEARELILEARGASFKNSGILVILGGAPARKRIPILSQSLTYFLTFCSVIFWCFFECMLFRFVVILGARRFHFGSHFHFILKVPDLGKTS